MKDDEFEKLAANRSITCSGPLRPATPSGTFQSYGRFDVSLDRDVLSFTGGPRPPVDCDI